MGTAKGGPGAGRAEVGLGEAVQSCLSGSPRRLVEEGRLCSSALAVASAWSHQLQNLEILDI